MRAPPRPAFARWRGSSARRFSRCGSIPVEILPPLSARAAVHLLLYTRCPPLAPCPPIPLVGFINPLGGPEPRSYERKPPLQAFSLAFQRKTAFPPCGYRATVHHLAKSLIGQILTLSRETGCGTICQDRTSAGGAWMGNQRTREPGRFEGSVFQTSRPTWRQT